MRHGNINSESNFTTKKTLTLINNLDLKSSNYLSTENVIWESSSTNVIISGPTVTKTSGSNNIWDSGAVSSQTIFSKSCNVEFTNFQANTDIFVGLNSGLKTRTNYSNSYTFIDFSFHLDRDTTFKVWENGINKGAFGQWISSDKFTISCVSSQVLYYKNGVLIYTSTGVPDTKLYAEASLLNINSTVTSIFNNSINISSFSNGVNISGNAKLLGDLNAAGSATANNYNLFALNTAPASATASGTTGEIRYTSDFIYVCVAPSTWRRSPLSSW